MVDTEPGRDVRADEHAPRVATAGRRVGGVEQRVSRDGAVGVDSLAMSAGSPSALSVTLVTVPGMVTGLPASSMAWNEAATVGPPLLAG